MVKSGLNLWKILQQVVLGSVYYLTVIFLYLYERFYIIE